MSSPQIHPLKSKRNAALFDLLFWLFFDAFREPCFALQFKRVVKFGSGGGGSGRVMVVAAVEWRRRSSFVVD